MEDDLRLPSDAFAKLDAGEDELFYEPPRLVLHIDDGAIAALTELYRAVLPAGGVLLDLMSSWVSHLPPEIGYGEVIGHGLNAAELAANPRLDRWFVQNLNRETRLSLADAGVDAAMICVSIQYLQQPVAVLRDVRRVLRRGARHQLLEPLLLDQLGMPGIETRVLAEGIEDVSDPMIAVIGHAPEES